MLQESANRRRTRRGEARPRRSVWPTASEILLLRAALVPEPAAWTAWRTRSGDLDRPEVRRLLPLVAWNLQRHTAITPPELEGVVRASWIAHRQLLDRLPEILDAFRRAAVTPIVHKGLALAETVYPRGGLRPTTDVDLLVAPDERRRAAEALERLGYRPRRPIPESRLARLHAVAYSRPASPDVDLHGWLLEESCFRGADMGVRERAVPLELAARRVLTLSPTDHLLQAIVHGLHWSEVPPLYWVADAASLIRERRAEIDWDVLAAEAAKRRVAPALTAGLRLLRDELGLDLPPGILALLAAATAAGDRREMLRRMRRRTFLGGVALRRREAARLRAHGEPALTLWRYFGELWGARTPWQIPLLAWRRLRFHLGPAGTAETP